MLNPEARVRAVEAREVVRTVEEAPDTQMAGRQPPRAVLVAAASGAPVGMQVAAAEAADGTAEAAAEPTMTPVAQMPVAAAVARPTRIRSTPKMLSTLQV